MWSGGQTAVALGSEDLASRQVYEVWPWHCPLLNSQGVCRGQQRLLVLDKIVKSISDGNCKVEIPSTAPNVLVWYPGPVLLCSVAESCPTLCNPMDCRLSGSSVHGIFHASILEWVAIPFSRGSSRLRDRTCISCIGRQILYHCATWFSLISPVLAAGGSGILATLTLGAPHSSP